MPDDIFVAFCQVAFGMDIDSIHDATSPFPSAIHTAMEGLTTYMKSPVSRVSKAKRKINLSQRFCNLAHVSAST